MLSRALSWFFLNFFFFLGGFFSFNWFLGNKSLAFKLLMSSLFLSGGILSSSSFLLFFQLLFSDLFLFHLVDGFNQDTLVLELVTFGTQVEVMVDFLADLLGVSILSEKSSQNSLSSHPEDFLGHSGVLSSLSLTVTTMSSLSFGFMISLYSSFGVHVELSSHYQSIFEEFSDVFT